ncbi:MAG: hypothetical protein ABFR32_11205 [Bacteroidota bacterium]
MKHSILMYLFIGVIFIFFGCTEDTLFDSQFNQSDQKITLKKGNEIIDYKGECTPNFLIPEVTPEEIGAQLLKGKVVTWYDNATDLLGNPDPLVTGTTIWYVNEIPKKDGTSKFWGKAELLVGVENPDDPEDDCLGKWDMTWHGYLTPIIDEGVQVGIKATCDAVGTGKEGIVKGLVSKSYYEMNFIFGDITTLVYYFEGSYH